MAGEALGDASGEVVRAADDPGSRHSGRLDGDEPPGDFVTQVVDGRAAARGRRFGPVPVALERVGRQGDAAGAGAGEQPGPVDVGTAGERFADRRHQPGQAAVVPAQGADRGGGRPGLVDGLLDADREHGVGTALDEDGRAEPEQGRNGLVEPDGFPQVAVPVGRVQLGRVQHLTGHRGHERNPPRSRRHLGQHGRQFLGQQLDLRRVRGVIDGDAPRPDVHRNQQLVERGRLTGHHDGRRPVHRGDRDSPAPRRDQFAGPLDLRGQRHHATQPGQPQDRLAPQRDHAGTVLKGQSTRDNRGGDLTLRVPDHGGGLDAVRTPHLGQRHHDRPQHGLHDVDPLQIALERVQELPVDELLQCRSAFHHPRGEHRRGFEEFPAHPRPLRTLAGEDENDVTRVGRLAHAVGDHVEPGGVEDDGAVLAHRAGGGQRAADVDRVAGQGTQGPGEVAQCRTGLGRQHPRHHGQRRGRLVRLGRHRLDDHVGVGPADPERRHPGPSRRAGLRPRHGFGEQPNLPGRPVHVRRRRVDVQRLRQQAVAHRFDHLDHATDSGGGLRVPDVRFQRPQPQRPVAVLAVGRQQRLGLDRVAQRRAGAVRLDDVHIGRCQPRAREGGPDHPLLRRAVRRGEAVGRTIGVDRRAAQHGQHGVVEAAGVGKPFQHEHPGALAPGGAVGGFGEGLAAAVGGEPALLAELDEPLRRGHHGDPAGERERALACPQGLRGEVQGDERRRAGRVDGQRRAFEAEGVGDPAGEHAGRAAGQEVPGQGLDLLFGRSGDLRHPADEHPGAAAAQAVDRQPGAFERLVRDLQEQPLLRVHRHGFARRDAEELGVEVRGLRQEPALAHVAVPGLRVPGPVQPRGVPAAVSGEATDRVGPGGDQVPQPFGRVRATGIPAGRADDRDRLARLLFGFAQPRTDVVQIGRDALEEVAELVFTRHGWSSGNRGSWSAAGRMP